MSGATRETLTGLLVAIVVGAGLYWIASNPALAVAAGLAWGGAAGVTVHLVRRFPDRATGSDWRDSRWTGLGVGAVVFGAGYAGYVTESMAELERAGE